MRRLNQNQFEELDLGEDEAAVEDKRSMLEVMREKRIKQEKENEEAKNRQEIKQETVEERKARLAAQRDLLRQMKDDTSRELNDALRQMKEEKRQQELEDFNNKLQTQPAQDNLYNQFKKMDEGKKLAGEQSELDKRR